MRKYIVSDSVQGMSLARYLSRAFPLMPSFVQSNVLKKKDVRVNGVKSDGTALVSGGDELSVYLDDKYLLADVPILFEDDDLLVLEKPAGLPVDADEDGIACDTLLLRAQRHCVGARLCHRLDAGTGGVIVLSKTDAAYARITEEFAGHNLEKRYQCVVKGIPDPISKRLTHYLKKDAKAAKVACFNSPVAGAKNAILDYHVLETMGDRALVEIVLLTGRTHQIRVQMAQIGHPLLGDDKYGDRAFNKQNHVQQIQLWCTKIVLEGKTFTSAPKFGGTNHAV